MYATSVFFVVILELMLLMFLVYVYVLHCRVNSGNHVFGFAVSSIVAVLDVLIHSDLLIATTAYEPTIALVRQRKFERVSLRSSYFHRQVQSLRSYVKIT